MTLDEARGVVRALRRTGITDRLDNELADLALSALPDDDPVFTEGRSHAVTSRDTAAEAAWAIAGNGFMLDEHGSTDLTTGWNALVEVSAVTLLNIDEPELSARFAAECTDDIAGALVWIRQTTDGQVSTVQWAADGGTRSGTDMVNAAWDAFIAEQDTDEED